MIEVLLTFNGLETTLVGYVDLLLSYSPFYAEPSVPSPGILQYTHNRDRLFILLSNAWQESTCTPQNCCKPLNLKRALSFFTCLHIKQFETNLNHYTKKNPKTIYSNWHAKWIFNDFLPLVLVTFVFPVPTENS